MKSREINLSIGDSRLFPSYNNVFATSPNLRPKGTVGALALIRHEHLLLEVGGRRKHETLQVILH